ncbi:MAG: ThiF family adenylyltransferase [Actinomycetota bacterium]|nr:ThiF family adenylyltransferase [Actinomycetota bacterium]
MAANGIEISAIGIDPADFDSILDIRYNPSSGLPFSSSARVEYSELVGAPSSVIRVEDKVLLVCDIGVRSKTAAVILRAQGFPQTYSLAGGADELLRLKAMSGPTGLSSGEAERYDRQIRLSGFGIEGQKRILASRVTVVGAGGLGCPALSYLAAAGVGTISVIDDDTVDMTNLQRQPLYGTQDVGALKVEVAARRLNALNPDVTISPIALALTTDNAKDLIAGSNVVIDATDNFQARYALNDATVELGLPLVYASVYAFEGQLAAFSAESGPCYRCLFPVDPSPDAALDCSTVGVLGAVTGVLGSLQASAALQIAGGVNHDLYGTLTMFDARTGLFDRLQVKKRDDCVSCG